MSRREPSYEEQEDARVEALEAQHARRMLVSRRDPETGEDRDEDRTADDGEPRDREDCHE